MKTAYPMLPRSATAIEAVRKGQLTDLQMGILTACEHAGEDGIPLCQPGVAQRVAYDWTEALGPLLLTTFVRMNGANNLVLAEDGAAHLKAWRKSRIQEGTGDAWAEA